MHRVSPIFFTERLMVKIIGRQVNII